MYPHIGHIFDKKRCTFLWYNFHFLGTSVTIIVESVVTRAWRCFLQKERTHLVLQGVQFAGTQYVSQYANNENIQRKSMCQNSKKIQTLLNIYQNFLEKNALIKVWAGIFVQ